MMLNSEPLPTDLPLRWCQWSLPQCQCQQTYICAGANGAYLRARTNGLTFALVPKVSTLWQHSLSGLEMMRRRDPESQHLLWLLRDHVRACIWRNEEVQNGNTCFDCNAITSQSMYMTRRRGLAPQHLLWLRRNHVRAYIWRDKESSTAYLLWLRWTCAHMKRMHSTRWRIEHCNTCCDCDELRWYEMDAFDAKKKQAQNHLPWICCISIWGFVALWCNDESSYVTIARTAFPCLRIMHTFGQWAQHCNISWNLFTLPSACLFDVMNDFGHDSGLCINLVNEPSTAMFAGTISHFRQLVCMMWWDVMWWFWLWSFSAWRVVSILLRLHEIGSKDLVLFTWSDFFLRWFWVPNLHCMRPNRITSRCRA